MSGNHRLWGRQGFVAQGVSLLLSALLIVIPVSGVAAADESSAAVGAALAVASDPAGASVYVDGQLVGETPLSLDRLSAGDHRVRVVKNGYLENGRIVNVSAGKTSTVDVKLTPNANASESTQIISGTGGGGGGGSRRWLWIGLAGGGAVAAVLFLTRNKPPIPGTIGVSPSSGTGMAAITSYSFSSVGASDPNGDPLTYTWNFGDGTSGSGQSVTKTYANAGTYSVVLTVSDGKESVDTPAVSITVARSMAGVWSGGQDPGWLASISVNLTQNGTTLGGTMTFSGNLTGTVPLASSGNTTSATIYPTSVTFSTTYSVGGYIGTFTSRFTGTTNSAGSSMSGTCTNTTTFYGTYSGSCTFSR
jgi:hypothetical protein